MNELLTTILCGLCLIPIAAFVIAMLRLAGYSEEDVEL